MRPPFDPELEAALVRRRDEVVRALEAHEIVGLRDRSTTPAAVEEAAAGRFRTSVLTAVRDGRPGVEVVLLRPAEAAGPVPWLLHLHGGGLVTGTAWDDVVPLLDLAADAGCAIASVGYRLAPEHPYPAALHDAETALTWLVAHAGELGLDPARVVVEGISAGGGLAAALALLVRDTGGPALAGQLLTCPMLDDRNDSGSARQMAGHGAWDRTANATAWRAYLGDAVGGADVPAHAAPARASDLSGLPPAFLDVGSAETFRDEVVDYARLLWRGGGAAELHVWPGGFHGFDYFEPTATLSRQAREARRRWVHRLLARTAPAVAPRIVEGQR
ncbi:alpha/beta hydrolase [Actinotalea fermentans]|uniref:Esterase n=1 Tax=Actinotalea fermentans TaxID=43671 RepID=A0A511Z1S0_9CELL|nr:alpha/beta hydrolase [Actinotalea fermentans]KGM16279.1 esterase [Actinotalea fermentans ATCC 43279 = JCM 9966 = DSM 3133]GEN81407.1 esterase [Actinotalea fermentans]